MSKAKGDNTSIVNAAQVRPITRRAILAVLADTSRLAGGA
jgi:hypothetical protein